MSVIESRYDSSPKLKYHCQILCLIFSPGFLGQIKVTYNHDSVINIYVVYSLPDSLYDETISTLKKFLFGAVSVAKNGNTAINKYKYSGMVLAMKNILVLRKNSLKLNDTTVQAEGE